MNIEEFNNTHWGADTKCIFEKETRSIISVDFGQSLIGLSTAFEDDVEWVRCENIELINGKTNER